jgi:hypothetical protein
VTWARRECRIVRRGDPKLPVVEINRHAPGNRDRSDPTGLLQVVANLSNGEGRLALRALGQRQARRGESFRRKAKLRRPRPIDHHAGDDEEWDGDADLHRRRHAMDADGVSPATANIVF